MKMTWIVKVTRRGQTTIPIEIRKKYNIRVGDKLLVEIVENGILFRKIPRIEEMAGIDSEYGDVNEVKREIEKMREEY